MPRFFCEYCDAFLTHDSVSGRRRLWGPRTPESAVSATVAGISRESLAVDPEAGAPTPFGPRHACTHTCPRGHSQVLVRKQHNSGLKHKANVRSYYKEFHQALNDPLQGNLRAKEELQRQIAANFNAAMMSGPGPARGGGPPRGMYMPPGGR